MNEGIKVNDGGGLFDGLGLIDSLIVDCEKGMKALISGSPLEYAAVTVGMVQKLGRLKEGVKKDTEEMEKQIRELRALLPQEEGQEDAAGFVCDTLDGTMGSGEERLRDAVLPEGGGLEQDPDHPGA
jgi:hypothetical protein